jgi:hypothetical protein
VARPGSGSAPELRKPGDGQEHERARGEPEESIRPASSVSARRSPVAAGALPTRKPPIEAAPIRADRKDVDQHQPEPELRHRRARGRDRRGEMVDGRAGSSGGAMPSGRATREAASARSEARRWREISARCPREPDSTSSRPVPNRRERGPAGR